MFQWTGWEKGEKCSDWYTMTMIMILMIPSTTLLTLQWVVSRTNRNNYNHNKKNNYHHNMKRNPPPVKPLWIQILHNNATFVWCKENSYISNNNSNLNRNRNRNRNNSIRNIMSTAAKKSNNPKQHIYMYHSFTTIIDWKKCLVLDRVKKRQNQFVWEKTNEAEQWWQSFCEQQ